MAVVYDSGNEFVATFVDKFNNPLVNVTVTFKVNTTQINAKTDSQGTARFVVTQNIGSYIVNVTNPLTGETVIRTLNVLTQESIIATDTLLVYGVNNTFKVSFTDAIGNPLSNHNVWIKIAGKTIEKVTDSNGIALFEITESYGIYIAEIVNPQTHEKINKTITVITDKTINSSDMTVRYGSSENFTAVFVDKFNKPLANVNATFKVGNSIINTITDANGAAGFKIDLNPGTHNVLTVNPVTGERVNNTIIVNKLASKITAPAISGVFNIENKLIITLTDVNNKAIADTGIVVKLNSGVYNLKTNANGQATLSTKSLHANVYDVSVEFSGDARYASSSVKSKITVQKASVKLIAKKAKLKLKSKTKKYSVTLKNNINKPLAKVKLTLKVKGKTYKAKTNKKGKATFKIKKLKKKGTFKGNVTFKGDKNYNKITKKVKIKVK